MGKTVNKSFDYYIRQPKMFCSVIGVKLVDRELTTIEKISSYFRLMLSILSPISIFVPQVMLLVIARGDLEILTEVGCTVTTLIQHIFKIVYLTTQKERIYKLYIELQTVWSVTDDVEERKSFEKYAGYARKISIAGFCIAAPAVYLYAIVAAINYLMIEFTVNHNNHTRYLPYEGWYGPDVLESPKYEVTFLCQVVGSVVGNFSFVGMECASMTSILHVCGQFKLLSTWLHKLGIEIDDTAQNSMSSVEEKLLKCIRHHQRIIDLADETNDLLMPIAFVQVLTSGALFCITGFALIINHTAAGITKSGVYLIAITIQLLAWSFPGEMLIQTSQEVGAAAYLEIPWYKLSLNKKRYIILVVLRAQRQCGISAMIFQSVCFNTMTSVFNTAASYFALLRQIKDEQTALE